MTGVRLRYPRTLSGASRRRQPRGRRRQHARLAGGTYKSRQLGIKNLKDVP
jgi:hypothetical protein